jgi:Uma2 family endonuclease
MSTAIEPKTQYTPEDLLAMPDGRNYELVGGRLVQRRMGMESGWVGTRLASALDRFREEHGTEWAVNAENGYQCFPHDPDLVRRPDVSFVRYGRFPDGVLPKGWSKIRPDLVVEVVSPNETVYDLEEKLEDYQNVGVPLIWVINRKSRTAKVYRGDGSVDHLREDGVLSGDDIIPGFRCHLREILPLREPSPAGQQIPNEPNGQQ